MVSGKPSPRTIVLGTAAGLYLAYVVVIGGDFKPTGRFIVPVLPMLAVPHATEPQRNSSQRCCPWRSS